MVPSTNARQAALDIAAGIEHAASQIAAREEDAAAFEEAGMTANAGAYRKAADNARELHAARVEAAKASTNPHLPGALKVHGVTL